MVHGQACYILKFILNIISRKFFRNDIPLERINCLSSLVYLTQTQVLHKYFEKLKFTQSLLIKTKIINLYPI